MATILFDRPHSRTRLFPLTFTRPISEIRVGILTISEKWKKSLSNDISWLTEPYLSDKFPARFESENLYINGTLCPDDLLVNAIRELKIGEALYKEKNLLAFKTNEQIAYRDLPEAAEKLTKREHNQEITIIHHTWNIFQNNGAQIKADIKFFSHLKINKVQDPHTIVYNPDEIYLEEGARVKAAILNAENGPIYIGKKCGD